MFTGIVAETGTVRQRRHEHGLTRLAIAAAAVTQGLAVGESVAVDGVCLTVVAYDNEGLEVELGPETLSRTTLGRCRRGDRVNLEPAMRFGDRLGGHLVTGHVDGVGRVVQRQDEDGTTVRLSIEAPAAVSPYLVPRGSVTVDGVSLTVVAPHEHRFSVALIPHTLTVTTLARRRVGDDVNLEGDIMAKYLKHLLEHGRIDGEVPWSTLGQAGAGENVKRNAEEDVIHDT